MAGCFLWWFLVGRVDWVLGMGCVFFCAVCVSSLFFYLGSGPMRMWPFPPSLIYHGFGAQVGVVWCLHICFIFGYGGGNVCSIRLA